MELLTAIKPPSLSVICPIPADAPPSVYAAALPVLNRIEAIVIDSVMIVCDIPTVLLLNVAVSPVPGMGEADQLGAADHKLLVAPFHVALAAWAL